jgi:hypothetical protein
MRKVDETIYNPIPGRFPTLTISKKKIILKDLFVP